MYLISAMCRSRGILLIQVLLASIRLAVFRHVTVFCCSAQIGLPSCPHPLPVLVAEGCLCKG